MSVNKIKMTPEQLRIVVDRIIQSYEEDYKKGQINNPHYEQSSVNGHRFKIGYMPGVDRKTIIDIRITDKGNM